MNRSVRWAVVVALASFGLAATGAGALSTFDDRADVPDNVIGAGMLSLDVSAAGASTGVAMTGLHPGAAARQMMWATNDLQSTVPATVSFSIAHLVDTPAPCNTDRAKAIGEIVSGIAGCTVGSDGITGIPASGVASHLIRITVSYLPTARSGSSCAAATRARSMHSLDAGTDLYTAVHRPDPSRAVTRTDGTRVVLAPGAGVCIAVDASWPTNGNKPGNATPSAPVDDAAQGDSVSVEFRFDLDQVLP